MPSGRPTSGIAASTARRAPSPAAESPTLTLFIEIIGWVAALLILGAYALLTAGKLTARSPLYQWMNVLGAAGFIVNSGWNGAYPSAVLNVIWAGIGAFALWSIAWRKRSSI